MSKLLLILLLFIIHLPGIDAQTFTDSNLPIILIDTDGGARIPDEPRVLATMRIINRGEGQRNYLADINNPAFLDYTGRISIEVRGTSTQVLPKKQYGLTTLLPDNKTENEISVLGLPKESDWILNGLGFDPSLIRDYLCYNLSRQMGNYATRTVYCEVVLNGMYNGLYLLQEKMKQDANRIDVIKIASTDVSFPDVTGGYITKSDRPDGDPVAWKMSSYIGLNDVNFIHVLPKPENAKEQQSSYLKEQFLKLSADAYFRNSSPFDGYPSIIDIPSFIDYMLLNEFAANPDAYQYSTYYHKDRNGKLKAGPVWDLNLSFWNDIFMWGFDRSKTNTWQFSNKDNEGPQFWTDLFNDPVFRCLVRRRWKELTAPGNPFNKAVIEIFIDQTAGYISEAAVRENGRWGTIPAFDANIQKIKNFIQLRTSWIDAQLSMDTGCSYRETPSLVITRIMYHPVTGNNNPEFLEITNTGASTVDLSGIYFGGTGFVYNFPVHSMILPGRSLILTNNPDAFLSKYGTVAKYNRLLPDKGFDLRLLDAFGTIIDRVTYSSADPWPSASDNGKYLELTDNDSDNNIAENWTASDNIRVDAVLVDEMPAVAVYPNPFRDIIHIEAASFITRIQLTDVQGKLLVETAPFSSEYNLNSENVRPGLYILRIWTVRGRRMLKLVKL